MPRPKGSKNKKTLEKEAALQQTKHLKQSQQVANTLFTDETLSVQATALPTLPEQKNTLLVPKKASNVTIQQDAQPQPQPAGVTPNFINTVPPIQGAKMLYKALTSSENHTTFLVKLTVARVKSNIILIQVINGKGIILNSYPAEQSLDRETLEAIEKDHIAIAGWKIAAIQ